MLPPIVAEDLIDPFNLAEGQGVTQGMCFNGARYRLVGIFSPKKKLPARALACQMLQDGTEAVVTESERFCRVWAKTETPPNDPTCSDCAA